MSSGFFLPGKSRKPERKRRKALEKAKPKKAIRREQKKPSIRDEEVSSDSDASLGRWEDDKRSREVEMNEPDDKTAQEKRLRLTKEYLAKLHEKEREQAEDESLTHAAIAHRLKEDVLEQAGKLHRKIASQYCEPDPTAVKQLRGHRLSVTCLAVTPDDKFVYTGSKDCSIIKWRLDTFSKDYVIPRAHVSSNKLNGHTDHILCLAVSSDGKFLASGGRDRFIHIWSVETNSWLHTFKGHRDAVSGLAFRKATHQLFSCSHDRTVKIWSADEMAYIDTLFGHQDSITGIDSLVRERAVTAGGNDRTVRVWKVVEESQLVFHGHRASIDCIKQINEDHFVSGSQDGSIALWSLHKKKPAALVPNAHGQSYFWADKWTSKSNEEEINGRDDGASGSLFRALTGASASSENSEKNEELSTISSCLETWVTAVTAIPNSDFIASGSSDSLVKFWECSDECRSLSQLFSYPVTGFVNGLAFAHSGNFLAAAVGQEHRLGRWWTVKEARNSLLIIPLHKRN